MDAPPASAAAALTAAASRKSPTAGKTSVEVDELFLMRRMSPAFTAGAVTLSPALAQTVILLKPTVRVSPVACVLPVFAVMPV